VAVLETQFDDDPSDSILAPSIDESRVVPRLGKNHTTYQYIGLIGAGALFATQEDEIVGSRGTAVIYLHRSTITLAGITYQADAAWVESVIGYVSP